MHSELQHIRKICSVFVIPCSTVHTALFYENERKSYWTTHAKSEVDYNYTQKGIIEFIWWRDGYFFDRFSIYSFMCFSNFFSIYLLVSSATLSHTHSTRLTSIEAPNKRINRIVLILLLHLCVYTSAYFFLLFVSQLFLKLVDSSHFLFVLSFLSPLFSLVSHFLFLSLVCSILC